MVPASNASASENNGGSVGPLRADLPVRHTRASADEVQPTETVTTSQLATAPTNSELTVPATANPALSTATPTMGEKLRRW